MTLFFRWVTQITTNPKYPDMILSSSRDKSLIVWKLTREDGQYGYPQKRLTGHGHFVSDVVLSSDGHFALSGSWDHTLRLWDLATGSSTRRYILEPFTSFDHSKPMSQWEGGRQTLFSC